MPLEYAQLRGTPYSLEQCKHCGAALPEMMRGMVHSWWRKLFRLPYCAVICHRCKCVTGWEKPE